MRDTHSKDSNAVVHNKAYKRFLQIMLAASVISLIFTLANPVNDERVHSIVRNNGGNVRLNVKAEEEEYAVDFSFKGEKAAKKEVIKEGEQGLKYKINKLLRDVERSSRGEERIILPGKIDGVSLEFYYRREYTAYYILLMGIVLGAFMMIHEREHEKELREKKNREMEILYPNLIEIISLFLGCGLGIKETIRIIARDRFFKETGLGVEIDYINGMLEVGNSLEQSVIEMQKRINISSYKRLGALLVQYKNKGGKGVLEELRKEAISAKKDRLLEAKKEGERIAAKMLIPITGLLLLTMMIVMIPAFMAWK